MGLGMAVASAGPHANNLHLAPDRQPHQQLIAQFLQVDFFSWCPTNSVKAQKDRYRMMLTHVDTEWR